MKITIIIIIDTDRLSENELKDPPVQLPPVASSL